MKASRLLFFSSVVWFLGCASLGSYNLPSLQKEFQGVIQRNEPLVSRANGDFVEKKVLVDTLSRSGQANWPKAAGEVSAKLAEMNRILPEVNKARSQLTELNGQISALAYNRTKVGRDDEAYERADQIVHEFDNASHRLSDSLNLYTRATNDLSDIIAKNGLFVAFDIGAFQKRIQAAITSSNSTIRDMNAELSRSERILNLTDEKINLAAPQGHFEDMGKTAKEFCSLAQTLPEISGKIKDSTMANAKISSIDPTWPAVQKYIAEFEETNTRLAALKNKFNDTSKALQASLKDLR